MSRIMRTSSGQRRDELLTNLSELSEACPFHQANPEDCPLYPLRRMRPANRLAWLKALSEEDLKYLATYHHVCLKIKVESLVAAAERAEHLC